MSTPDSTAADMASRASPEAERQTPLEVWRLFDLNGRRAQLDKQGLDIADRQESSAASRKQLTISTRAFKASDAATISKKDVGHLLKRYQTEVDALTTRARCSESAFLSLYKALYDAPDPVEELSKSSSDARIISELQEEVRGLKEERGSWAERTATSSMYQKKVEELEAQLATTNDRVAEEVRTKIAEEQTQWMAAQQKAIEAYELREQELLHQLRLGNENARRLQASADDLQRQLNETSSHLESVRSNRANVTEMATEDLERTRAEAKSLRQRCVDLETQLAAQNSDDMTLDPSASQASVGRSALSAELAARDVEVSQLKDQVSALEEVLGGKDQEKRNEFAKLAFSITEKDENISKLQAKLKQLPSVEEYESMSRQFETLKSFQLLESDKYAAAGGESENGDESVESGLPLKGHETLEKRLLAKVKSLEGRLTRMRVDFGDKDSRINELLVTVRKYEEQVGDQKSLISKLEEGINAMTGDQASVHALKRRAAAASKSELGASKSGEDEPGEDNGGGAWDWGERHQAEGLQNIIREEPSMLDIVAGQRDRFRARTMELESDIGKLMERIEKLTSDMDSLKGDNVRLYEKIRFVQSYKQSNGSLGNGGVVTTMLDAAVGDEEEGGSLLGKYRSMYEDMVNPYTIFNRRERHKRMSEMSAPERLTLRASQRALSTRTSRLIVFFYIIALHVLVALVLGFSASMQCDHDVTTKAQH